MTTPRDPPPGPDLDRAGLFLPEPWAQAPWIAALVGARAVVTGPKDADAGRLDAVVTVEQGPHLDRAGDYARRWRLPVRVLREFVDPVAPPRLGIAPLALLVGELAADGTVSFSAAPSDHAARPGARYVNPFTLQPVAPDEGVALMAAIRARYAARRETVVGFGFSAQKARTATTFLAGWSNEVVFETRRWAVAIAARKGARLVAWGARGGRALEAEAAAAGVPVSRIEDGFVRSVGLGTQQTIPASLALDDLGLYYDAHRPSRLERLCLETDFTPALVDRARALRERLVATRVTKYNLPAPKLDLAGPARGRPVVLVIGQVPDDAAIRFGTAAVGGNLALLSAVRKARPDAFVVYKEHPDLVTRSRAGWLPERAIRAHADLALREGDAIAAIEAADEVHVLTSLAGFEALIRAKPVVAWGIPFYAGWGLTDDRAPVARRGRKLSLDELVAAVLILYPAYVDPVSRLPCEVEDVIARIEDVRAGRIAVPSAVRNRRLVRASVVAEAYWRHWIGHFGRPR